MKRSTCIENKATNRRKAEQVADLFEIVSRCNMSPERAKDKIDELLEEEKGIAEKIKKMIESLALSYGGQHSICPSLRDFTETWIERRRPEISFSSLQVYTGTIKSFISFLAEKSALSINKITTQDIVKWRNFQCDTEMAPATVNRNLKIITMIFDLAKNEGFIKNNPTDTIDKVKQGQQKHKKPFTEEQLKKIIQHSPDEWKSMIRFSLYTGGQRLGDVALLKWSDIDIHNNLIMFRARKTNAPVVLPMHPSLKKHILEIQNNNIMEGFIHKRLAEIINKSKGNVTRLSTEFRYILYDSGIMQFTSSVSTGKKRTPKEYSFHCIRATAATMLNAGGVAEAVAQNIVGHANREVHRIYVGLGRETIQNALSVLPDV